jgi:hypothetical protein
MKKPLIYVLMLICTLIFSSCKEAVNSFPEMETNESLTTSPAMPPKMDTKAVEKAGNQYMTPGIFHKKMAEEVGTWEEKITIWSGPFDTKPTSATITSTTDMIFNGLFQETVHKGEMMGMAFEGKSTLGYDRATKMYISTWIDNRGSSILVMKGNYDAATKKIIMEGKTMDPVYKKSKTVREEVSIINENEQKIDMFDATPEGKPYKSMSIIRTRQR